MSPAVPARTPSSLPVVTPELERLLTLDLDRDVTEQPLDEIRTSCRQCQDWDRAVSLTRRLAQGRLDVLRYEARRRDERAAGTERDRGLLFDLPDILADSHGGSAGRAIDLEPPGPSADALAELLDRAADPGLLARPEELDEAQLTVLAEALVAFEHELSGLRRGLHARIDAYQSEIGRRYRDGEVTVESVLG